MSGIDLDIGFVSVPANTTGVIAGEPPGIVTIDNVPSRAEIDLFRRSDRAWLRRQLSADDGRYRFNGLASNVLHDVVARDLAGAWEDVIVGGVLPFVPLTVAGRAPVAVLGRAYGYSYTVSGGELPYSFEVASGELPPGVSLDATSGLLSGTPTTAGIFSWTVSVTDARDAVAAISSRCSVIDDPFGANLVLLANFNEVAQNLLNGQQFNALSGASIGPGGIEGQAGWTYAAGAFDIDNAAYVIGSEPFTLDFYTKPISAGAGDAYGRVLQTGNNSQLGALFIARDASYSPMRLIVEVGTGSGYARVCTGGGVTLPDGAFTHVEVSRDSGGIWRLFIGGQKASEQVYTGTGSVLSGSRILLGWNQSGTERYNGGYDQMRLVIGAVRHTENFSPPPPLVY